ncbi:cyclic nucleotide-binding domain-containing protein [Aquibium carbonis]|uniref:Cyclic nucleotide-binding domain-containing protein n=1 Tax=Aquibium carbonis TaxID=2495581 RepID=A0A429YVM9_9HYPH|nr:adenylate/guanylate cyclase domain-containing protein [Aquibium carbonis]RST85511.1 cyclic nucleotide-binding domain-containing protein [Aquibium carbonis]
MAKGTKHKPMDTMEGDDRKLASGIEAFLARFSSRPRELEAVFKKSPERLVRIRDGDVLCNKGDEANEVWIIQSGRFRIEAEPGSMVSDDRVAGQIVGEQAFFRTDADGQPERRRGATIRAAKDSQVLRVDAALLDKMTDLERALWYEACARSLSAKLDEATAQRVLLRKDRVNAEMIFSRFVAEEGQQAALAAFMEGNFQRHIDTEECGAVIWFSDVKGFSKFAKGKSPEEVGRTIREIMDIQAQAIRRHGGQIDKFMGDGLMAYWKAPDHSRLASAASNAARAALECAKELGEHFEKTGLPCDVRIGLHAGSVIFGDFGGSDRVAFTIIGDAVNSASRYEQARSCSENKDLGRVRVSQELFDLLTDDELLKQFEPAQRMLPAKDGMVFPARIANV